MPTLTFTAYISEDEVGQKEAEQTAWPPISLKNIHEKFEVNLRVCLGKYFSELFKKVKQPVIKVDLFANVTAKVTVEYEGLPGLFSNYGDLVSFVDYTLADRGDLTQYPECLLGLYKDPYADSGYDEVEYTVCTINIGDVKAGSK